MAQNTCVAKMLSQANFTAFHGTTVKIFSHVILNFIQLYSQKSEIKHSTCVSSTHFYRSQCSCGKVMFSQACVKNSVNRGDVYPSMHRSRHPTWQTPPPRQTLPDRHPQANPPFRHPPGRHPPLADTPHWQTPPWQIPLLVNQIK